MMVDETHDGMTPDEQEIWRAGFDTGAETLTALRADLEAVAVALRRQAIVPEYDFPGDTRELYGWSCLLCDGEGESETDINHKEGCDLARAGVLEALRDGT